MNQMSLPATENIRTQRLLLRRPRLTDAQALFDAFCQFPHVTRYMSWRAHQSTEETLAFLTRLWSIAGELLGVGAAVAWKPAADDNRAANQQTAAPAGGPLAK